MVRAVETQIHSALDWEKVFQVLGLEDLDVGVALLVVVEIIDHWVLNVPVVSLVGSSLR